MARDFDGVTNRIDWAAVADLSASALTISAWIYSDWSTGVSDYVIDIHRSGDTANGILLYISNTTTLTLSRSGTTILYRTGVSGTFTGGWHHVLATHTGTHNDATTIHIYVDGTECGTYEAAANGAGEYAPTGSWALGGKIFADDRNYDGKIAEFAVWNAVKDSATIAALANGDLPSWYATNLLFYYSAKTDTMVAETGGTGTNDASGTPSTYTTSHPVMNQRVTLDAAVLTATPIPLADVTIITSATVILDAAVLTATPIALADVNAPISRTLDPAVLTATPINAAVDAPVTRVLDTAALTATGIASVIVEQQYIVLDPAVLTATGIGASVSATLQAVVLDTASLTATPVKIADVNAPVTRTLDPAVLTATGIAFTVVEDQYITLDTAAMTATGIQNVIISNSLALMDTSVLTLTAIPFRFAVTITLETG